MNATTPSTVPHILGAASRARLVGVHPRLIKVVELAIVRSPQDFSVLEGVRSRETMWAYWGKGRTAAELRAKGVPVQYAQPGLAKVTWLNNPLSSNHRVMPDGYGHAVDLTPYHGVGVSPWPEHHPAADRPRFLKAFDVVAGTMLAASAELGIPIRWGADWDQDGKPRERGETDSPHFELAA